MLLNHVERVDRAEKSARSARSTRLSKRYGEVIGKLLVESLEWKERKAIAPSSGGWISSAAFSEFTNCENVPRNMNYRACDFGEGQYGEIVHGRWSGGGVAGDILRAIQRDKGEVES